jgi:hypothetical protein
LRRRDNESDPTNVQYKQYKPNWNCHCETSPPYNGYILIKNVYSKKRKLRFRKVKQLAQGSEWQKGLWRLDSLPGKVF